ncbi:trypsin-like peptidase domain-containing protein [Halobacteriovorax sp. HFRX-2_2]|uniref:S1C family serine protease n=1 Tax=unclassified Halobacteriovorax TaxID=2639665 RepID=UPI003718C1D2
MKSSLRPFFLILILLTSFNSKALFDENKAVLESERNTISVFDRSVNSVVNISTLGRMRTRRGFFFSMTNKQVVKGEGSGWVWDDKGHIITNYHVVEGGDNFLIRFNNNKKEYKAKLVGTEPAKDIAVLKLIEVPRDIKPLNRGDSDKVRVGQKAIAIGSPFGLDATVTTGIISAKNRGIQGIGGVEIRGMLQTDSSINPGNSGGPLFDSSGNVIGVNTMIFSNSGSSAGVGFAIPINIVSKVVPQIIKYGMVKRPGLGIAIAEKRELSYFYGIDVEKGLPIQSVRPGGPSEKAGLKGLIQDPRTRSIILGDVILKIDGKEINDFDDIFNTLYEYKVGDKVEVLYRRGSALKKAIVKLEEIKRN